MRAPVSQQSFALCSAASCSRRRVRRVARNATRSACVTEFSLGSSRDLAPVPAHIGHFYSGLDDLADQLAFARSAIADPDRALLLFGPRGAADVLLRALEAHVGRDLATERA